jgi:hypothetical protein
MYANLPPVGKQDVNRLRVMRGRSIPGKGAGLN